MQIQIGCDHSSLHSGEDVGVPVDEELVVAQLHLHASVVGQQHGVALLHDRLDGLAPLVDVAWPHLEHGGVVVALGLLQDEPRGGLGLRLQLLDEDAVERGQDPLERH